ncbi:hypothetical protein I6A84_09110 [Frankia sp. CNm7]|uniref:Uncharacterized protein n=1 Tax=Frankia nepalensis TaxID=1836974 RepID=A0A937RLU2_9ACTN|nr:hypothetical protein [Frankia nepalensis]MBL7499244.1 hypothetical protein [Frankia nepalensis]MBL7512041.1 hypothetical protein [Frankia nepalensis]MBL7518265.1 hypothetical protein [Frankia nepalensis]MBL7628748.1 hypothetical protein [Frankia nepalensis]
MLGIASPLAEIVIARSAAVCQVARWADDRPMGNARLRIARTYLRMHVPGVDSDAGRNQVVAVEHGISIYAAGVSRERGWAGMDDSPFAVWDAQGRTLGAFDDFDTAHRRAHQWAAGLAVLLPLTVDDRLARVSRRIWSARCELIAWAEFAVLPGCDQSATSVAAGSVAAPGEPSEAGVSGGRPCPAAAPSGHGRRAG